MSEQLEKAINDVKSQIGSKERELYELTARLRDLEAERARLKYGISVGSLVTYKGKTYRVTTIDAKWDRKPWVYAVAQLKSGEFGTGRRVLYSDWELL